MTTQSDMSTAYLDWEVRWRSDEGRSDWLEPEVDVRNLSASLLSSGARRVLDLGCGVGRHSLHLASLGFSVCALDASKSGINHALGTAGKAKNRIDFRVGAMTDLPYEDDSFDYVLAWNVIYHGDGTVVRRCIREISRVLKPGCLYQGTMLSKRNINYRSGREVAPNTLVGGDTSDKEHPHYYCNARDLIELFEGFEIMSLSDREQKKPGSYHWHLVAESIKATVA